MKLVGALEITAAAPLVILPENFRMTFDEPLRMPRQDQILPVGQRLAQAFKRLASHDDDVAHRRFFEPLEILRQMPRDFAARANHAVQRHCNNGLEVFHEQSFNAKPQGRKDFLPRMDTDSTRIGKRGAQCLTRIARIIAN